MTEKPLPTTTPVQDLAENVIKNILIEVALKVAIAQIIIAVPFLGFPIINPVFIFIAEKLVLRVFAELARVVNFEIIDIRIESERKNYEEAVSKLRTVLTTPEVPNDQIEKAKEEFRNRLHDLIHFDGV
jgi:hypothetical protein